MNYNGTDNGIKYNSRSLKGEALKKGGRSAGATSREIRLEKNFFFVIKKKIRS